MRTPPPPHLTADLCGSASAARLTHTPCPSAKLMPHPATSPRPTPPRAAPHPRPSALFAPSAPAEARPVSAAHHMQSLLDRAKVARPAALRTDGALSTANRVSVGAGDVELVTPHHVHLHELEQIPGACALACTCHDAARRRDACGATRCDPAPRCEARDLRALRRLGRVRAVRCCSPLLGRGRGGVSERERERDGGMESAHNPPPHRSRRPARALGAQDGVGAARASLALASTRASRPSHTPRGWHVLPRDAGYASPLLPSPRLASPRLSSVSLSLSPHPAAKYYITTTRRSRRVAGGSHGNDLVSGDQMLFKDEFLVRGKMSLQVRPLSLRPRPRPQDVHPSAQQRRDVASAA